MKQSSKPGWWTKHGGIRIFDMRWVNYMGYGEYASYKPSNVIIGDE